MDVPQLWHIDPRRKTGEPLIGVAAVLSTTGIAEVADDAYMFAAENFHSRRAVYVLDFNTGEFEIALEIREVTLVNGIRARNGSIYLVSGELGSLYRVPVDEDARPNGTPELIAADISLDDFDIADDETIYGAAVWENRVVKVRRNGEVTVLFGGPDSIDLLSCTSIRLGRTARDSETIYVTTMGNGVFPEAGDSSTEAKIVALKL